MHTIRIQLNDAGKRFNRDWIFRHLNYSFSSGNSYAITGPNGSGKSTLLQAIAGSIELNEGLMEYVEEKSGIGSMESGVKNIEDVFQSIAVVAPYLELIEEMTATEFLQFHGRFKPMVEALSIPDILSVVGLAKAADKQIRHFSSGMKQRLKLAQAIFSHVPVLLLDEPCTNLDAAGYQLYHQLIEQYCSQKLIIVSSNDPQEMDFCTERLRVEEMK